MKQRRAIWIGVLLITILFSQISCGLLSGSIQTKTSLPEPTSALESQPTRIPTPSTDPTLNPPSNQDEEAQAIHNATVLIRMQSPQMQKTTGIGVFLGSGMGSLIQHNGIILLVTHDHWGEMLQDYSIVEFRDADNKMIKPIYGYEFKKLIIYQDAGTLVLHPPQELIDQLPPVNVDTFTQVTPGATVEVVHRENPAREKAAIQKAVVEEIITYQGLPIYSLRSLDGQQIKPGDSGGGIWFNGALVGNTWVTLAEKKESVVETSGNSQEENLIYTDLSYAAILPLDIP